MKKVLRILAVALTVLSILASLTYLVLLSLSQLALVPVLAEPNVLLSDWVFIAIPILGLLTGILLQVASLEKPSKKK